MFFSVCALPSPTSAQACTSLFSRFNGVGSEEARDLTIALASVRRSNGTDGFPVYSFHDEALTRGANRRYQLDEVHLAVLSVQLGFWQLSPATIPPAFASM
jgi:hypothetical protein